MRKLLSAILICGLALMTVAPARAGGVSADAAFERLSSLAGTWKGDAEGEGEEAEAAASEVIEVVHQIEMSAAGTVVMETMGPGTPHEMINMYHVDGDDLVMTHYCAAGNQPRMRLNRESSTDDVLVFDFDGGTNLDPAVDQFIHSAEIRLLDGDRIESNWKSHAGGEEAGRMSFRLARSE